MVSKQEVERRYGAVREAMDEHGLDAVVVCGTEYTGFEGSVTYMSGFVIVHRYAYVLLPREGEHREGIVALLGRERIEPCRKKRLCHRAV